MAAENKRFGTVKPLYLSGKGKKMFRAGDKVTPEMFPAGQFDERVKSGHIIEAKPQVVEPTIESEMEKTIKAHAEAEKTAREEAVNKAVELGIEVTDDMDSEAINFKVLEKEMANSEQAKAESALVAARKTCDKYEIQYAEDADIDTLNQLIAEYEEKNTKSFVNAKGKTIQVKSIDDISKNELMAELEKANAVFDKNAKKPVLYGQWLDLK